MKIVRIYTGEDGESHFEDIDISLDNPVDSDLRSELIKATGIIFRETGCDYDLDFHNAPRRQFMINLEGSVEIVTGDGSSRILGTGDILLAEDTTGRGHISRAVNNQSRKSVFVTLD
ncbi:MAG: hypothetical protein JSU79_06185 [Dehalococcoidales bacterium]|nr:MAG: hypothetical protein JSU79_06185 [Dehalococcoidales bacterium]